MKKYLIILTLFFIITPFVIYFLLNYRTLTIINLSKKDLDNIIIKNTDGKTIKVIGYLENNSKYNAILKKNNYNIMINEYDEESAFLNKNTKFIIKPLYKINFQNFTERSIKKIILKNKHKNVIKEIKGFDQNNLKSLYLVEGRYLIEIEDSENSNDGDLILANDIDIKIYQTYNLTLTNDSKKPIQDLIISNKYLTDHSDTISYLGEDESASMQLARGEYYIYYRERPGNKILLNIESLHNLKSYYSLVINKINDENKYNIILKKDNNQNLLSNEVKNNLFYTLTIENGVYRLSLKRKYISYNYQDAPFITYFYINNKKISNVPDFYFFDSEPLRLSFELNKDLIDYNDNILNELKIFINSKPQFIKWAKIEKYKYIAKEPIFKLKRGDYNLVFSYKKNKINYDIKIVDDDDSPPIIEKSKDYYNPKKNVIPINIGLYDQSGINTDEKNTYIESIYYNNENYTDILNDNLIDIKRSIFHDNTSLIFDGKLDRVNFNKPEGNFKITLYATDADNDNENDSCSCALTYTLEPLSEGYFNNKIILNFSFKNKLDTFKQYINDEEDNLKNNTFLTLFMDDNVNVPYILTDEIESITTDFFVGKLLITFEFKEKNKYKITNVLNGNIEIKNFLKKQDFTAFLNPFLLNLTANENPIKSKPVIIK